MRRLVAALGTTFLLASCTAAQSIIRGGLSGIVADSQGAGIPEAQVEVTSIATAVVYKTASSTTGTFSVGDLPPGDYRVAVTYPGFTTMKAEQISISAGVSVNMPVTLLVDAATTTIEVNGPLLRWVSPVRSRRVRFLRKRSPPYQSTVAALSR